MAILEEAYFYLLIEGRSRLYLRFTDDLFLNETLDQFLQFGQKTNRINPPIKFDFIFSKKATYF